MNRSVHQLIRDKQTEITEGRERAEKVFVEDGQEEERKALAALMGITYITLDTFLQKYERTKSSVCQCCAGDRERVHAGRNIGRAV